MNQIRQADTDATHRPLLRVAVGAVLFLLALAAVKSYRDLALARDQEAQLRQEVATTERSIATLKERIDRIERDPTTLEQLAREELGWVRDGDLVIVLPDDHPSPSAGAETAPAASRTP